MQSINHHFCYNFHHPHISAHRSLMKLFIHNDSNKFPSILLQTKLISLFLFLIYNSTYESIFMHSPTSPEILNVIRSFLSTIYEIFMSLFSFICKRVNKCATFIFIFYNSSSEKFFSNDLERYY